MLYRVRKEKGVICLIKNQMSLDDNLLLVIVASKGSLLVEQFQMEYNQLPEKFLSPA